MIKNVQRTGLILYVKQYDRCIDFYHKKLQLKILFKNEDLTCFDFFGTYLIVEKEDRMEYLDIEENQLKNFSCIRIHLKNIKEVVADFKTNGLTVDYQEHNWGTVAKFKDPDGNLIALKDEESFIKQIETYIPIDI